MSRPVWLLVPDDTPATGGNLVSADRLSGGLARLGWAPEVWPAGRAPEPPPGTVVHALHAVRAGRPAASLARRCHLPLVLTLTGTDINDEGASTGIEGPVAEAAAVLAYHEEARRRLLQRAPAAAPYCEVIAPGVAVPPPMARSDARRRWNWAAEAFVFLLPAGMRQVKQPFFAVEPLARLRQADPRVRFVLAGPLREAAMEPALRGVLGAGDWIQYLGEVPHGEMPSLLAAADVVLNTSESEGLSNAVLEAMASARPVLAADIPGNRAAVRHGIDGLLYRNPDEFLAWASRLARAPTLRDRLGDAARSAVRLRFAPESEAAGHDRLYRRLVGADQPAAAHGRA